MKQAYSVIGGAFGDEGKGNVTDFLTRKYEADIVVRFNGGSQTAHNVIDPSGVHHCFHQIGSGTLAGADTFLSRFFLLDPILLDKEIKTLSSNSLFTENQLYDKIIISPMCRIITPYHIIANRIRESYRQVNKNHHGSCGMGIGETRGDDLESNLSITVSDLVNSAYTVINKLSLIRNYKRLQLKYMAEESSTCQKLYEELYYDKNSPEKIALTYSNILSNFRICSTVALKDYNVGIFEGSQGVLLDEQYGFHPHTTWTNCTFENAETLLRQIGCTNNEKIMVFRTFMTRHGAGPFPTEDNKLFEAYHEVHNKGGKFTGSMRIGHFDMFLANYSIDVAKPDVIALTHCDTIISNKIATSFRSDSRSKRKLYKLDSDIKYSLFEDLNISEVYNVPPIKYKMFGPCGGTDGVTL